MAFRAAKIEDVPAIVNLIETAYRGERSRAGWTTEADLLDGQRTDTAEIEGIVGSRRALILVAELEGDTVGCCQLEVDADRSAYLGMLAVHPGLQGRGLGRAVVREAERLAHDDLGSSRLRMMVIRQREDVICWYERLGYSRTDATVPFPYGDDRKGIPRRADLEFVVLARTL